jgi:hypothetical protein
LHNCSLKPLKVFGPPRITVTTLKGGTMKNGFWVVLALGLFVLASARAAFGDGYSGETFDMTGTGTQTSGPGAGATGSFTGSLTLGSQIGSSSDWTVSGFDAIFNKCGASDCSTLVWTFPSLEFDASNDTLLNNASTDFTGSGGDSRELVLEFVDGNTTIAFLNNDLTEEGMGNTSNDKAGTLSYSVSAVPEPSSMLLLIVGLLGLAGIKFARKESETTAV